ncbi:EamA family transporter [Hymenobacter sp. BT770]|uniref:EamA family transporter n=1 Tax=Hymenobacter sp. BT770 TaxID=2886942 RepID=UPI001D12A3EF|nr:EamA family transporter [Hymenobacter sp. BT770]MCC3154916.1 EamA family transporter [Hymenobacter sp. BT770]MDO3417334.1 EamA family transporter [Hymenobacter sp. BT770]
MSDTSSATPSRVAMLTAFAAVYLIWGSTYLVMKFAVASMPPLLMAGTRYGLAGGLLYAFMRLRGEPRPSRRGWGHAFVIGICLLGFGNGGTTIGVLYLPSGTTSLLVATVPMFLALLGWLSGVTPRPTRWVTVGLAAGMLGMYLLAAHPSSAGVPRPGHAGIGVTAVLLAALLWSVGSLYSKKNQPAPSPFLSGGMQMLCGGAAMLVVGLVRGEASGFELAQVTAKSWMAYAYLVTFGSIVAFTAYIWLLRVVEPALAGTYAFVNPVVAVLLGWAFAGEVLNPQMLGGAALIVLAVVLVVLGGRRKPNAAVAAHEVAVEA